MSNLYNLKEINQQQALDLCKFNIRNGQNILLLGRRGCGKSEISMHAIREAGFKINYINMSVLDRNDFMGYPNLFDTSDVVNFKAPYYLPLLKDNKKPDTIILLDEIDKCAPELTAPLLEALQYKSINGRRLNVVAFILTGNLLNEGAYNNSIASPILDRCFKYILTFDFNVWLDWARKSNLHPLVLGFLMHHQDLAVGPIETIEFASPSPRGWEYVSNALMKAAQSKITDIDTITSIVAGFCGESAAVAFENWYRYSRQFEKYVNALIEHGECDKIFKDMEPTEQFVFTIMACSVAKNKVLKTFGKKRFKYLDNLIKFFIDQEVPPEMQLASLNNAFPFEVIADNKLYESKSFYLLVSSLRDESIKTK